MPEVMDSKEFSKGLENRTCFFYHEDIEGHKEENKDEGNVKFDELSNKFIGLANEIHKKLGLGLLENTYKQCLAYELGHAKINFLVETE